MSSRTYLCRRCGVLRRSSAVPVWHNLKPYPDTAVAPQHCGEAMKPLTYEQGVAATHTEASHRVQWAAQGLYIYRRGGKRKWIPAVTARQVEQAQQQYAGYLSRQEETKQEMIKRQQRLRLQKRPRTSA